MSVEKIKKLAADLGVTIADLSKAIAEVAEEEKKVYVPRDDEFLLFKTPYIDGFCPCIYKDGKYKNVTNWEWKPLPKAEYIDMIGRTFAPPGADWYAVSDNGVMAWFKHEPRIVINT